MGLNFFKFIMSLFVCINVLYLHCVLNVFLYLFSGCCIFFILTAIVFFILVCVSGYCNIT